MGKAKYIMTFVKRKVHLDKVQTKIRQNPDKVRINSERILTNLKCSGRIQTKSDKRFRPQNLDCQCRCLPPPPSPGRNRHANFIRSISFTLLTNRGGGGCAGASSQTLHLHPQGLAFSAGRRILETPPSPPPHPQF